MENLEWIIRYMRSLVGLADPHRLLVLNLLSSLHKDPIQDSWNAGLGGPTHVRKGSCKALMQERHAF